MTNTTNTDTGTVTEQVTQGAQQVAQQTGQAAGQVVQQATQQVQQKASGQKDQMAQNLNDMAGALRQAGQNSPGMASNLVDTAASQVERVANYLENSDVQQIVSDTENLARNNPALFLGGAFALGLLASRFLKASAPSIGSASYRSGQYGYGGGSYGSGYGQVYGQSFGAGYSGGQYDNPPGQPRYDRFEQTPPIQYNNAPAYSGVNAGTPGSTEGYGTDTADFANRRYTNDVYGQSTTDIDDDLGTAE